MSALHRVRRVRLRVRAGSSARALELRRELRSSVDSDILPALARAFDAVDVADRVVRIPVVRLHVRVKDRDGLIDSIRSEVEAELRRVLGEPSSAAAPAVETRGRPPREHVRAALLDYLVTGRLHWSLLSDEEETEANTTEALRREAAALVAEFGTAFTLPGASATARRAAAFRWFRLLDEPARRALLERATVVGPTGAVPIARLLSGPAGSSLGPAAFESAALVLIALHGESIGPSATVFSNVVGKELSHFLIREISIALKLSDPPAAEVEERADDAERDGETARSPVGEEPIRPAEDVPILRASASESAPAKPEDGHPADDAGLVLLHPFLPRLFDAVGIRREGRSLRAADLPRAAALLRRVATGRDAIQEYELTFVKALLGRRPEDILLVGPGLLSSSDRDEAEAMLSAAIRHWGALGNTVPDGLRASFLRRRGLLWENEAGWRLNVEPRGFDVLLGRLPWGFDVVRLPWMNRPIFTDWPTP